MSGENDIEAVDWLSVDDALPVEEGDNAKGGFSDAFDQHAQSQGRVTNQVLCLYYPSHQAERSQPFSGVRKNRLDLCRLVRAFIR